MTSERVVTIGKVALTAGAAFCGAWVTWALVWQVQEVGSQALSGLILARKIADLVSIGLGGLYCLVGVIVLIAGDRRAGVLALGAYLIAQGYAIGYLHSLYGVFHWEDWRIDVARIGVNLFAYVAAMRTTQLFPRVLKPGDLIPQLEKGPVSRIVWETVAWFLTPLRVWLLAAVVLLAVPATGLETVFHLGQLLVITLVVVTLTGSYRSGGPEVQRKIYWLLTGAIIFLIARVISLTAQTILGWIGIAAIELESGQILPVVAAVRTSVWVLANVGLLACVLAAVFYEGAVSPRLVLKRTAVYSSGVGVLLFTFAVFVNFISEAIASALQITAMTVEAVGGAVIALLFRPLHAKLSQFAEQLLPKPTGSSGSSKTQSAGNEID